MAHPWLLAALLAMQAPVLDRRDPAAVAAAYVAALERSDVEALGKLVVPDKGVSTFLRMLVAQARNPEMGMFSPEGMGELLLLPFGLTKGLAIGPAQPQTEPGRSVFELRRELVLRPKLVLARQADGAWAVDLRASLQATAPGGKSTMLMGIEQMGALGEEGTVRVEAAAGQPWACIGRMNNLREALEAYAEEHKGKYPFADAWMDQLAPYVAGEKAFACVEHAGEDYGYAFNKALSEAERGRDWEQNRRLPLLACVAGDKPNATFEVDRLARLKPRHGKVIPLVMASGEQLCLPAGMGPREVWAAEDQHEACRQRLRALVDAAKAYAQAHDGRLPSAATWSDDLRPLVARRADGDPFVCPTLGQGPCTYAINRAVAGKRLGELVNHRKIVLFVETVAGPLNAVADDQPTCPGRHRQVFDPDGAPTAMTVTLSKAVVDVTPGRR